MRAGEIAAQPLPPALTRPRESDPFSTPTDSRGTLPREDHITPLGTREAGQTRERANVVESACREPLPRRARGYLGRLERDRRGVPGRIRQWPDEARSGDPGIRTPWTLPADASREQGRPRSRRSSVNHLLPIQGTAENSSEFGGFSANLSHAPKGIRIHAGLTIKQRKEGQQAGPRPITHPARTVLIFSAGRRQLAARWRSRRKCVPPQ